MRSWASATIKQLEQTFVFSNQFCQGLTKDELAAVKFSCQQHQNGRCQMKLSEAVHVSSSDLPPLQEEYRSAMTALQQQGIWRALVQVQNKFSRDEQLWLCVQPHTH